MTPTREPFLPPPLDAYWRGHSRLRQAYARLAGMSLAEVGKATASTRHVIHGVVCHEFIPPGTHDPRQATVLTLPFANPMRLDMAMRAWLIQASSKQARRIIVFPQNALRRPTYALSKAERGMIRKGDFGPIAMQQHRALKTLGVEQCDIIGYSLGAAIGARLLRELAEKSTITIGRVGLFEMPNTLRRSLKQLTQAFGRGGWKALYKAVADAKIPALSELRAMTGPRSQLKDKLHFLRFVSSSLLRNNQAIMAGCGQPTFAHDITEGLAANTAKGHAPLRILLGAATQSALTPPHSLEATKHTITMAGFTNVRTVEVEHYGHELGDNIIAHTALACMALE